jgi:glycosyltransferase involved in cell wall biosynthesis
MPQDVKKKRVSFSVINCICFDQRVQKIAETVSRLDCDITIIGRRMGECCDSDLVPFRTKRFNMFFRRGFFFYKFFNVRLFFYLLFHKFDILVANDLDTLAPNYFVSKLKRLPLVYDSHEYFTEVPELNNKPFRKWFWKTIERSIFPHLKYVMTVCDSIAIEYETQYKIRPLVVRNCAPSVTDLKGYSRQELGINEDDLLLVFQGGGINIDRGGEELVESMRMTENVFLLIIGSGDVWDILKNKVNSLGISERIRFIPKSPWTDMMRYTLSADAGLTIDKDTNLNYHFILPNKLFDYIASGIAVIASDVVEVRRIMEENNCGIIIPSVTPEEISKAIVKLRDSREFLNKLKQNSVYASESLNWENESKKVTAFYKQVFIEIKDRIIARFIP